MTTEELATLAATLGKEVRRIAALRLFEDTLLQALARIETPHE